MLGADFRKAWRIARVQLFKGTRGYVCVVYSEPHMVQLTKRFSTAKAGVNQLRGYCQASMRLGSSDTHATTSIVFDDSRSSIEFLTLIRKSAGSRCRAGLQYRSMYWRAPFHISSLPRAILLRILRRTVGFRNDHGGNSGNKRLGVTMVTKHVIIYL